MEVETVPAKDDHLEDEGVETVDLCRSVSLLLLKGRHSFAGQPLIETTRDGCPVFFCLNRWEEVSLAARRDPRDHLFEGKVLALDRTPNGPNKETILPKDTTAREVRSVVSLDQR